MDKNQRSWLWHTLRSRRNVFVANFVEVKLSADFRRLWGRGWSCRARCEGIFQFADKSLDWICHPSGVGKRMTYVTGNKGTIKELSLFYWMFHPM